MRKNRVSPLLERPWLGTNYSRDGGSSCDRAYEVTVHVEVVSDRSIAPSKPRGPKALDMKIFE